MVRYIWRPFRKGAATEEGPIDSILVTGGAGFIGSHIVEALLSRGSQVAVIDNLSTGFRENLREGAIFYQKDIGDPKIAEVFKRHPFKAVIHCAAQTKVVRSMRQPLQDLKVNVLGTHRLLRLSHKYRVRRFLFLSSGGAIYGERKTPAKEEDLPTPQSYYALHKLLAEYYVKLSGLSYAILRLGNIYGPRQRPDIEGGVVAIFIDRLLRQQPIEVFGDGEQRRDFAPVSLVVHAVLASLAMEKDGLWNIGCGSPLSVNQLLNLLVERAGPPVSVQHLPPRPGELLSSSLDISQARRDGLFPPLYSLDRGLEETVAFFRQRMAQGL